MLSEKLKLEVGPLLTILTYMLKKSQITFLSILCGKITLFLMEFTFDLLFQLEMGLVCHFKMLKTMLPEKLKLEVGPLLTIFSYLFKRFQILTLKNSLYENNEIHRSVFIFYF